MEKLDVKKEPHYKGREGVFQLLEVPDQSFLMIVGSGDPNTSKDYELSLEALYLLAYALKSRVRMSSDATTSFHHWKDCGGRGTWKYSPLDGIRMRGSGR